MTETPSSTDENLILLTEQEAFHKHLISLIQSSRRHIIILSRQLNFQLFNNDDVASALSAMVRQDRNATVKILIKDVRPIVEVNHAILRLSKRLPSKVIIRHLQLEPEDDDRSYIIGDQSCLLYLHDETEFSGFVNYDAGPEIRPIKDEFVYLWEKQSTDDANLRNLHF